MTKQVKDLLQEQESNNSLRHLAAKLEELAKERAIVTKAGVPLSLLTEVKRKKDNDESC